MSNTEHSALAKVLEQFPERPRIQANGRDPYDVERDEAAACIQMQATRLRSMSVAYEKAATAMRSSQHAAVSAAGSLRASEAHGNLVKRKEAERRAQKAEGRYVRLENHVRKLQHLARREGGDKAHVIFSLLGLSLRAPENPDRVDSPDPKPSASWFTGICSHCGYPVVVTQGQERFFDYAWYCSNPGCVKHFPVANTGDMERPEWVTAAPKPVSTAVEWRSILSIAPDVFQKHPLWAMRKFGSEVPQLGRDPTCHAWADECRPVDGEMVPVGWERLGL